MAPHDLGEYSGSNTLEESSDINISHCQIGVVAGKYKAVTKNYLTISNSGTDSASSELTEEQASSFTSYLRDCYKSDPNCHSIRLLFGTTKEIKECFVNLTIVNQAKQREKSKQGLAEDEKQLDRERYLTWHEDIHRDADKEPIKIDEIFNELLKEDENKPRKRFPRKILVHGWAGIGKTTLLRKIAYEWATGELWKDKFKYVLRVQLRKLNTGVEAEQQDTYSLINAMELLDKTNNQNYKLSAEQFGKIIHELHQDEVLFLLDGYDELNTETQSAKVIKKILKIEKWHCIVTSRPTVTIDVDFDSILETIGFTDDNIEKYVKKFFKDDARTKQLIEFLKSNPSIYGLAHIPINLELICSVFKEEIPKKAFANMTQLYQKIEHKLFQRMLDNMPSSNLFKNVDDKKITDEDNKEMVSDYLQKLAFVGISQNRIILKQSDMVKAGEEIYYQRDKRRRKTFDDFKREHLRKVMFSQFLQSPDAEQHEQKDFYFLHLTFQEYFAARYLSQLLLSEDEAKIKEAKDFIKNHKYEKRLQYVFWFTVGLLNEEANYNDEEVAKDGQNALKLFFATFFQAPRDLIGDYEALFLMQCMEEGQLLEKLKKKYREAIWLSVLDVIWRTLCKKEINRHFMYTLEHVAQTLSRCPLLIQSQKIEKLAWSSLCNHINTVNHIKKNMIGLLIFILPHCRLAFLHELLFPQLFKMLHDSSTKNIYKVILQLLNQHDDKLRLDDILMLTQKILPDLLAHKDVDVQIEALKLLDNHLDKVSSEVKATVWHKMLCCILEIHTPYVMDGKLNKHLDIASPEVRATLWHETLPSLLVHDNGYVRIRIASLLLEQRDKVPAEAKTTILNETLPALLVHKDVDVQIEAVKLLDKHRYRALLEVNTTLWHKMLRCLLELHTRTCNLMDDKLEKHLDIASPEVKAMLWHETLPALLAHDNEYVRIRIASLLLKHRDKVAAKVKATALNETLPGLLRDELPHWWHPYTRWLFKFNVVVLLLKYGDNVQSEVITEGIILVSANKFVRRGITQFLPEMYWDEASIEVKASVLSKLLPYLLAHDDQFYQMKAMELLERHLDKASSEVKAIILNETLPALLAHDDSYVRREAAILLDKHLEKSSPEVKATLENETILGLLVCDNKHVGIRTVASVFEYWDKVPDKVKAMLWSKTLPSLLADDNEYVRREAAKLLKKHFDEVSCIKDFISAVSDYFSQNKRHAVNITQALFKELSLLRCFELSPLLQFSVYFWQSFMSAREQKIILFHTEADNNKHFLYYNQQNHEEIPIGNDVIEKTLLLTYEKKLIELQKNDATAEAELYSLPYPVKPFSLEEEHYDEEKHFQQTLEIHTNISKYFTHYPNLLGYQIAYHLTLGKNAYNLKEYKAAFKHYGQGLKYLDRNDFYYYETCKEMMTCSEKSRRNLNRNMYFQSAISSSSSQAASSTNTNQNGGPK